MINSIAVDIEKDVKHPIVFQATIPQTEILWKVEITIQYLTLSDLFIHAR